MLKLEVDKLFKKLFVKASRTKANWRDTIAALANDGDITRRQEHVYKYHGKVPC